MGSAFRLPVWFGPTYDEVIRWCEDNGIYAICADAHGGTTYSQIDWTRPCALILGPESAGFTPEELRAVKQIVSVPMQGEVESLNVAVSAGVLLYEAARQRQS